MQTYLIEKTSEGIPLIRKNTQNLEVNCVRGNCMANIQEPSQPRDVEWYMGNVIKPSLEKEEIDDGTRTPYDDRKIRFDSASLVEGRLELMLGFTTYLSFLEYFKRSTQENELLAEKGKEDFGDANAYFPRMMGVATLLISSQGSVILGERTNSLEEGESDKYLGLLSSLNGSVEFHEDISEINPLKDITREVREEMGILPKEIKSSCLVGAFCDPSRVGAEPDFSYLIFTDLPDNYFLTGKWEERVQDKEHKNLVALSSFDQVQFLLKTGKLPKSLDPKKQMDLLYSARGILEQIRPDEMA